MSKRTKIIVAIVTVVVIAAVAVSFALRSAGSGVAIKTAKVSETNLGVTVSASGKIQAGRRAEVYPPSAGTLDRVFVKDGAKVKAGQRLAKMDTGAFEMAVKQAKAGLAQAVAAYDNLGATGVSSKDISAARAGVTAAKKAWSSAKKSASAVGAQAPTSGQLAAAKAARDAAKAAYESAVDAHAGAQSVYGSTSPTTTAAAVAEKQAYAGYLNAKSAYDKLRSTSLGSAKSQASAGTAQAYAAYKQAVASLNKALAADPDSQEAAAVAAIAQAEQGLMLARNNLENATLIAPIDGTVFFNSAGQPGADGKTPVASDGSAVSPGSAPFTVVDLGGSTFVAEVDEADIDRVKVNMSADVTLDSFAGETFKGKVTHLSPAAQPTATGGTIFPVDLTLTTTGKSILIGMKGDATIKVSSIPKALTIPLEALFNENGTNFVYKVIDGSRLQKTTITIGAQTDTDVEVLEGLQAGDEVALASPTTYTDGMTVRVKNQ